MQIIWYFLCQQSQISNFLFLESCWAAHLANCLAVCINWLEWLCWHTWWKSNSAPVKWWEFPANTASWSVYWRINGFFCICIDTSVSISNTFEAWCKAVSVGGVWRKCWAHILVWFDLISVLASVGLWNLSICSMSANAKLFSVSVAFTISGASSRCDLSFPHRFALSGWWPGGPTEPWPGKDSLPGNDSVMCFCVQQEAFSPPAPTSTRCFALLCPNTKMFPNWCHRWTWWTRPAASPWPMHVSEAKSVFLREIAV